MIARFRLLIACCGFAAFFALFFAPGLGEGRLLAPNDGLFQCVPSFYAPRTLWTTALFSGHPCAADPHEQAFYPVARLFEALLPGLPSPLAYNAFVIAGYAIAGAAAFALVRRLSGSVAGGLVGGLVFGASGFLVAHCRHTSVVHTAAWWPLALLALDRLRERVAPARIGALGLAVGMMILAGHPKFWIVGLTLAGAFAAALCRRADGGPARFLLASATGVALGLALGAPGILPALELSQQSLRTELGFGDFTSYALPPRQLPGMVFPYLFGNMTTAYEGAPSFYELVAYVGLLPLILAGIALARERGRGVTGFFSAVAAAGLLLALGPATPLATILYHAPVFRLFRIPGTHLLELVLGASALAGLGVAAIERADREARLRTARRAAAAAGAVFLGALLLALSHPATYHSATAGAVLLPLLQLALALGALALFARAPGAAAAGALLLAIAFDLAGFAWFCEWRRPEFAVTVADVTEPPALATLVAEATRTHGRVMPLLGAAASLEAAPANRSRLWGIESASGYDPLVLRRYQELLDLGTGRDLAPGELPRARLAPDDRALDLLAVRFVLPDGAPPIPRPRSLPRAWLVEDVRALAPEEILRAIRTSRLADGAAFDPTRTALVEDPAEATAFARGLEPPAPVDVIALAHDWLVVRVALERPAFLVLSDAFYPGWRAVLEDGSEPTIHRADYALRGVYLPAGNHVLRLEFRPAAVGRGLALGLAGLVACLGLLATALRPRG